MTPCPSAQSREPSVPLRPLLVQHPVPTVLASYGVALLQLHLGVALAAAILCCGSRDVGGGGVEVGARGL